MKHERRSFLRIPAGIAGATLLAASCGLAATFTVSNTNDSGTGSLRQAILDANATPGGFIRGQICESVTLANES